MIVMAACSREGKFELSGTIAGSGDSTALVLEQSSDGLWYIVDTVRTTGDGEFQIKVLSPRFPAIYRLRTIDGQQICFPIDSLEHIVVNTALERFGVDYELSGSDDAVRMMNIDKKAMTFATTDTANGDFVAWKDALAHDIAAEPLSMSSYYAINKWVGGKPLFDPSDSRDIRIIGAVANSFNEYRKQDPRTAYLVNLLLDAQHRRQAATAPATPIEVTETALLPIKLQDYRALSHDLQEVATGNRVVLLNFTMYDRPFSPALNRVINEVYESHHSKGFEVYQVSLDTDAVLWRQAAQNLPWITVYEPDGVNSRVVSSYAVDHVPTSFIIVNGELVARIDDATEIKAELLKRL